MARKFRLTCARTTYFDIEVEAEDGAEAERYVQAALADERTLQEATSPLGKPAHRIVEIAIAEEQASGNVADAA